MSIKVSVIIPVYNAEGYIAQCINSLLKQTIQECEFIFINDGSTDTSPQIIETFQKKDKRIKLINQLNQGVSSARNTGLKAAAGEYIGFVDADDWVEEKMYEELYSVCAKKDCDGAISNFESELEGCYIVTAYPFPTDSCLNTDDIRKCILPYFIKSDNLNTVCSKLYKNEIIKKFNIFFPEGMSLGEDGFFNLLFFSSANKVVYLNYTGYHYREVKGSATRNIKEKDYFARALQVYLLDLPEELLGEVDSTVVSELKSIRLINSVMSYIHIYLDPREKLNYKKRIRYIKYMINHHCVREALRCFPSSSSLGRYEKLVIQCITFKSVTGLFFVTAYSRKRNKLTGGITNENVNVCS